MKPFVTVHNKNEKQKWLEMYKWIQASVLSISLPTKAEHLKHNVTFPW